MWEDLIIFLNLAGIRKTQLSITNTAWAEVGLRYSFRLVRWIIGLRLNLLEHVYFVETQAALLRLNWLFDLSFCDVDAVHAWDAILLWKQLRSVLHLRFVLIMLIKLLWLICMRANDVWGRLVRFIVFHKALLRDRKSVGILIKSMLLLRPCSARTDGSISPL